MSIVLHHVSLERREQDERAMDLKRSVFAFVQGRYRRPDRRQVLRDISFQAQPGERIGIIGSNGAGKSTLLKVIAGVIPATSGEVRVAGTVAPLIELGAGFDPDLSVGDNIVMYGVLLGYSRAMMMERTDAILEFAELQTYKWALVKTLSSGMAARLGFAVASDVHPDVLLLDEVFAVGDEAFRDKSRSRIEQLWATGTASIVVSHDLAFVSEMCSRAVCMDGGRIAFAGAPHMAVRFYLDAIASR